MTGAETNDAQEIRDVERSRLRALVGADMPVAQALHAADFQLVHPHGGILSKEEYLGGIASGEIDYRQFERVSDIRVIMAGDLAVIRYQSQIDIAVQGQPEFIRCWHTDCYRRAGSGWQVVWSQATAAGPGETSAA
jgi:ketosteroid isomerase-like protein